MARFKVPTWLAELTEKVTGLTKQLPRVARGAARMPEDWELRAFQAAVALSVTLILSLLIGFWASHRSHPAQVPKVEEVSATVTPETVTHFPHIQPDAGITEANEVTATLEATSVPDPTATVTEVPKEAADPASDYPELVARVDAAAKNASFTPLQVMRNSSNDGYLFHWESQFTPPDLVGIPGGEIYAPYKQPYQYIQVFKLHALDESAERPIIVRIFHPDGQVEIKDSDLPAGKYEWTVWGWLRTRHYEVETAAMPIQPFEVTEH